MPIPKIIHQLWISPNGAPIPDDINKNTLSWENTHPDFIRITWTLSKLENLLKDFHGINLLEPIEQCAFPAMKSDIIRLALVYEHGGFWNDLKNYSLSPFLYSLTENDTPVLAEHWPVERPPTFKPHLANGFFGAPTHDQLIWNCLKIVSQNIKTRKAKDVFSLTGGGAMMNCLDRMLKSDPKYNYHLLQYNELWNKNIKRAGGSYNDGNQHWSIRQKSESCFID